MLSYCTIALISHASKVMLKILHARLHQYVNRELPDVQAGFTYLFIFIYFTLFYFTILYWFAIHQHFRKGRGTKDQIANIHWIIEKARRVPEKHLFLLS